MKVILLIVISALLTACIVQPAHNHRKTPKTKLEKEHNNKSVVIVNIRPAKNRKCWSHNRHWHCHN